MWGLSSPTRAQTLSPCSASALDSQGRPFTRHLYPREGLWRACLKSVSTPGPPQVPRRRHIVINQYWSHPFTRVHPTEKNDGNFTCWEQIEDSYAPLCRCWCPQHFKINSQLDLNIHSESAWTLSVQFNEFSLLNTPIERMPWSGDRTLPVP